MKLRTLSRAKTTALGWISRIRGRALVLAYHRVAEPVIDPHKLCVSPPHFAEHLEFLRRHAQPIPLQDLVAGLHVGKLPSRAVALTLDDGYVDNLHQGLPLLLQHGIPATVFVASGAVGSGLGLWDSDLAEIIFAPKVLPHILSLRNRGGNPRLEA